MKLKWNVYCRSINRKEIQYFNVFDHSAFYSDMIKRLKDCQDYDEFRSELKRDLMYYFAYKNEYEIGITEPFPHVSADEIKRLQQETAEYCTHVNLMMGIKVDVFQQIMMNYSHFIDYIWQNKEEVLRNND